MKFRIYGSFYLKQIRLLFSLKLKLFKHLQCKSLIHLRNNMNSNVKVDLRIQLVQIKTGYPVLEFHIKTKHRNNIVKIHFSNVLYIPLIIIIIMNTKKTKKTLYIIHFEFAIKFSSFLFKN